MNFIRHVDALEVLDSRGNPTIAVTVTLNDESTGSAMVPSGASIGTGEAFELRDSDPNRFNGKGVLEAVGHVRSEIKSALCGMSADRQREIDDLLCDLDGTENKSRLGANAILGTSLAVVKAAAASKRSALYQHLRELYGPSDIRMPVPMMNILNGGAHANNNIDIQEFMVVPISMSSFKEALRCGAEVFQALKRILDSRGFSTAVGDEGGFVPNFDSDKEALESLLQATEQAGYRPGHDVLFALDCAASAFYRENMYWIKGATDGYSGEEFCEYLKQWVTKYPIISIEDGLHEDDWQNWYLLTERLGSEIQLVGDDLFVTNRERLEKGMKQRIANALLVKLNQIGTLTETMDIIRFAQEHGYATVISHRSGETEDTTIADLAVATGAGQIKSGSVCRSDRTSKYNRLIQIEGEMELVQYFGRDEFSRFI